MEKIMAVYDVDPEYAKRFAGAANRKEKVPFTVVPFSSLESLGEYARKHPIEILLINGEVPQKQAAEIEAGTVITLSEGEGAVSGNDYPSVYKYQSADSLVREVMARYCDQPVEELFSAAGRRAKILGIYSPLGRCRKTSLALTMGQELARDGKVLYVSFEEFSGLPQMFREEIRSDLSDVLYFLRQGEFNMIRLRSMVYTWKDMDYIAPVRYPEDLEQMSGAEAADLLDRLAGETGYGYVIADIGRPARNLIPILDCCSAVYMPVREDGFSAARLSEFDSYLETAGRQDLREKIQRLKLPPQSSVVRPSDYLEMLLWGEFGDYVRKLLRGGM